MIGWKRIVVTVGEKIGKTHLTYAQGAAAEIIAMVTILAWPTAMASPSVTTHVLSSGVAGTMAANERPADVHHPRHRPCLDLHPPAAAVLSGCLFLLFNKIAS